MHVIGKVNLMSEQAEYVKVHRSVEISPHPKYGQATDLHDGSEEIRSGPIGSVAASRPRPKPRAADTTCSLRS